MATKQSVSLTFLDPSNAPLAGGSVVFRLNYDISAVTSGGPQVSAKRTVTVVLDDNGSCTVSLWPNNLLSPTNSIYFVTAYTAQGQPAWSGELTVTE